MPLLLTTDDTRQLITMREAIDVLEEGYRSLARHEAVHRARSDLQVPLRPGEDYWLATMEAVGRSHGLAAVRLRSDRHSAVRKKWGGRPGLFCGLVLLYDIETGELAAIINDGYLQVMRVAATSALGGRHLARPGSRRMGLIGTGWQAHDHARAFAAIFPLERIQVYSPNEAHRTAFAAEMSRELGIDVAAMDSARQAVEGCDLVATCTDSPQPVLESESIEPGTYVASLRFAREFSGPREAIFSPHVIHSPEYVLPSYRVGTEEEWAKGSDIYRPLHGDGRPAGSVPLHEVVGGLHPGRTSDQQRPVFDNRGGMGIQFVALGRVVLDRARERGIGRQLPDEWFLQDVTT